MRYNTLTHLRLLEISLYDPNTGSFISKMKRSNHGSNIGEELGHVSGKSGYRIIRIDGIQYRAHILAWFYVNEEWPPGILDHKNRQRADNRWDNLRLSDFRMNQGNKKRQKNNTSGYKGVQRRENDRFYTARIVKNGVLTHLGCFTSAEEAHKAYVEEAKRVFGEFANGG